MTSQPVPPVVPGPVARQLAEDEREEEFTDTDGTPVGEADHREDIRRAGGDPDEVEESR
jgi:hypothetical protein